ncbi:hypothetical protein BC830DRAFT_1119932 [Chytriomyces sp. MP71]|nr:hypothetical protein BC830DRAFT_1119932 [Chytriomyces sp. MP71]
MPRPKKSKVYTLEQDFPTDEIRMARLRDSRRQLFKGIAIGVGTALGFLVLGVIVYFVWQAIANRPASGQQEPQQQTKQQKEIVQNRTSTTCISSVSTTTTSTTMTSKTHSKTLCYATPTVDPLSAYSKASFYAGNGNCAYLDGPLLKGANLNQPFGFTFDPNGILYMFDVHSIRYVYNGNLLTLALIQSGIPAFTGLDSGVFNSQGVLYVVDSSRSALFEIRVDQSTNPFRGTVRAVVGDDNTVGNMDGVGTKALVGYLSGISIDLEDMLYVGDVTYCLIKKVSPSGTVTTLAGQAGTCVSLDGTGAFASFNYPYKTTADGWGNLLVTDMETIRMVNLTTGSVKTVAGTIGNCGDFVPGPVGTAVIGCYSGQTAFYDGVL